MDPTLYPLMGQRNPQMALKHGYASHMAKRKVVSHAAKGIREALVANLLDEVHRNYPNLSLSAAYQKISRATGASLSTLQRIASGNTSPQLDTLADIAHHLGTTVGALVSAPSPSPSRGRLRAAT